MAVRCGLLGGFTFGAAIFGLSFEWFPIAVWMACASAFFGGVAVPIVALIIVLPYASDIWLPALLRKIHVAQEVGAAMSEEVRKRLEARPALAGILAGYITASAILGLFWDALGPDDLAPAQAPYAAVVGLVVSVVGLIVCALIGSAKDGASRVAE